jgi:EamA domain-containing membrane protein RarD
VHQAGTARDFGLIPAVLVGLALNLPYYDKLRPLPESTIVVHGVVAVIGFVLLLLASTSRSMSVRDGPLRLRNIVRSVQALCVTATRLSGGPLYPSKSASASATGIPS